MGVRFAFPPFLAAVVGIENKSGVTELFQQDNSPRWAPVQRRGRQRHSVRFFEMSSLGFLEPLPELVDNPRVDLQATGQIGFVS